MMSITYKCVTVGKSSPVAKYIENGRELGKQSINSFIGSFCSFFLRRSGPESYSATAYIKAVAFT